MSILEAYAPDNFGNPGCDGAGQRYDSSQSHSVAPHSVEEALRRHGSLSEEQIMAALRRIEAAEAWLGPVVLGEPGTSD